MTGVVELLDAPPSGTDSNALLSVRDLTVTFDTPTGPFAAVQSLSFDLAPGRTLAIVGESGSGKSVTALSLMRLVRHVGGAIAGGSIRFRPEEGAPIDLVQAPEGRLRGIRGNDIAMIFQEPMTSLNPVFTIGNQIVEALVLHQNLSLREARREAEALLRRVRLPDAGAMLGRYPHQLSGGMRQRVMIAMALCCRPRLLIADEPTTALDVTIQAQILTLIRELQRDLGMAVLFITHDMGVVAEMADEVLVMWRGRKVEQAPVGDIFRAPQHPYTKALLSAVPRLGSLAGEDLPKRTPLIVLDGDTPRSVGETRVQDTADTAAPLLSVDRLSTWFDLKKDLFGRPTHRCHAVQQVSFEVYPGETLALVGESGSGKSTIGKTLQQLVKPTSGSIRFEGQDVLAMGAAERRRLRQKIQYVFQDPFAALDPRKKVGFSIAEPIVTHGLADGRAAVTRRVHELMERVGLPAARAGRYPHEFSGGQRQRICIARALASDPKLIIADESVSALDVSIQAQIVDLLMELQARQRLSYLFITHDMAVVEKISHRVAVLYLGQIVEIGPRRAVFETPQHSYTKRLLAAVPVADPARAAQRAVPEGEIPSSTRAVGDEPPILRLQPVGPDHFAAVEA
ncbi:MAG: ABC transporter ATP-binding protein [Inquilinus sp.]|uniref:ABC transporter ATP-binding protein n=1 Tax=Inquilinus sp. TaxID=1932117 RepID=UPI003F2CCA57